MPLHTIPSTGLIVARIDVRDDVKIEMTAPKEVKLRAGQDLFVRLTYRFQEASRNSETCQFRLSSSLGDESAEPATVQWEDRPGLPDELWGSLQQKYGKLEPGRYKLKFQVNGSLDVRRWSEDDAERVADRSVEGTISVVVE